MEIAEVRQLIKAGIPDCELTVDGEGCSFSVVVIGESFAGMSPVKRQQRVLATVSVPLSSGALHAISMKVYTPEEWARESGKPAPPSGRREKPDEWSDTTAPAMPETNHATL